MDGSASLWMGNVLYLTPGSGQGSDLSSRGAWTFYPSAVTGSVWDTPVRSVTSNRPTPNTSRTTSRSPLRSAVRTTSSGSRSTPRVERLLADGTRRDRRRTRPEIETPAFEGASHDTEPGRPPGFEAGLAEQSRRSGRGELTEEAAGVLEEARELTRRMEVGGDADEHGGAERRRRVG